MADNPRAPSSAQIGICELQGILKRVAEANTKLLDIQRQSRETEDIRWKRYIQVQDMERLLRAMIVDFDKKDLKLQDMNMAICMRSNDLTFLDENPIKRTVAMNAKLQNLQQQLTDTQAELHNVQQKVKRETIKLDNVQRKAKETVVHAHERKPELENLQQKISKVHDALHNVQHNDQKKIAQLKEMKSISVPRTKPSFELMPTTKYASMRHYKIKEVLEARGLRTDSKIADMVDRLIKDDDKLGGDASKSATLDSNDEIDGDKIVPVEATNPAPTSLAIIYGLQDMTKTTQLKATELQSMKQVHEQNIIDCHYIHNMITKGTEQQKVQQRIEEVKTEHRHLQQSCQEKKSENDALQHLAKESKDELENVQQNTRQHKDELDIIQQTIEQSKLNLQDVQQKISDGNTQLRVIQQKVDTSKTKHIDVEQKVNKKTNELRSLEHSATTMKASLNDLQAKTQENIVELEDLHQHIQEKSIELEDSKKDIEAKKLELELQIMIVQESKTKACEHDQHKSAPISVRTILPEDIRANLKQRIKEIESLEETYVDKATLLADLQWDEWWFGQQISQA